MTHLRIELNEDAYNLSARELVSGALIKKLYNIVIDPNNVFDGTSHLKGFLHVDATYLDYIDVLTDDTKDLTKDMDITATKIYLKFQDSEVERILLANNIGDGVGITRDDAAALTGQFNGNNSPFMNNTAITSFDEFEYFGYTSLYSNQWEKGAFKGCTNLLSISLKNITSIGPFSFHQCSSLLTVKDFHATTIGIYAFNNTAVSSIDLSLVADLGTAAFRNCTGLTTINLSSLASVGGSSTDSGVFKNCTGLTTVDDLNSTGVYMFYGCTGLTTVELTANCTTISNGTFQGCTSLSNIDLSDVTTLGESAFYGCIGLTSVDLSNATTLGAYTFYNCTTLQSVTLNNNLLTIPQSCFYGCSSLNTIDLSNVTSLGNGAFNRCSQLRSVDLSNCTLLGVESFNRCTNLTTVTGLGANAKLSQDSFYMCSNLEHIDFSKITSLEPTVFSGCSKLGYGGLTLELNLTDLSLYPFAALNQTLFSRLILHWPNPTYKMSDNDIRYSIHCGLTNITYIDISDANIPELSTMPGEHVFKMDFDDARNVVTVITPPNTTMTYVSTFVTKPVFKHLILLNPTPITLQEASDYPLSNALTNSSRAPLLHIYVPDAAAKAAYLADSLWSQIADILNRLHTLSELPVGIWKTGLYQQYEPYLSNSSDPAYATT